MCVMCETHDENINHLFSTYRVASKIWKFLTYRIANKI